MYVCMYVVYNFCILIRNIYLNLQIVLKLNRKLFFKNLLKIGSQNYLFRCYLILVLTCNFISCWHLLLLHTEKTQKINSFKIIIGFFTPPLFLATKVAISFVYYSSKTIKCTKSLKLKKIYRNQPIKWASAILYIISTRSCTWTQFMS